MQVPMNIPDNIVNYLISNVGTPQQINNMIVRKLANFIIKREMAQYRNQQQEETADSIVNRREELEAEYGG